MTLQQGLAFGLVGLTVAAFIWGRFRYDLVAVGPWSRAWRSA